MSAPNEKVSVSIKKKDDGNYAIVSSHALPSANVVVDYMTKSERKRVRQNLWMGDSLDICLRNTVPSVSLSSWVKAIIKAITEGIKEHNSSSEAEVLASKEGGFLSFGNLIFRLDAVDYVVGGQRALPVLRKRVIENARAEGRRSIENARRLGNEMIEDANSESLKIMQKLHEARLQLKQIERNIGDVPPSWLRGTDGLWSNLGNGHARIGLQVPFVLKEFIYNTAGGKRSWTAKPAPPVSCILWFRYPIQREVLEGVDISCSINLPHINNERFCVDFGQAIAPPTDYYTLMAAAQRIMKIAQVMDMRSPLTSPERWPLSVSAFIPKALQDAFVAWRVGGSLEAALINCNCLESADKFEPAKPLNKQELVLHTSAQPVEFRLEEEEEEENGIPVPEPQQ